MKILHYIYMNMQTLQLFKFQTKSDQLGKKMKKKGDFEKPLKLLQGTESGEKDISCGQGDHKS